jgi:hypothetical protein
MQDRVRRWGAERRNALIPCNGDRPRVSVRSHDPPLSENKASRSVVLESDNRSKISLKTRSGYSPAFRILGLYDDCRELPCARCRPEGGCSEDRFAQPAYHARGSAMSWDAMAEAAEDTIERSLVNAAAKAAR